MAETAPLDLAGKYVHFVGIGGSGMSGLARIAQQRGAMITGSDQADSPIIEQLLAQGIEVDLQQTAAAVPDACDLMVISAAIGPDHPQVLEAGRRGIPILKYAQMLGRLMLACRGVAVAGTHGKSSTTSFLSHIAIQADLDPSFIVGANCHQIGGGSRSGRSDILIAEACEYDRSFHNFHPTHGIILNIEEDHLDCYAGLDDIIESFAHFARKLPRHGTLLIHHEMPHRLRVTAGLECDVQTIGYAPQADWRVGVKQGHVRLHHQGEIVAQWQNPLPGEHMCYNAAAAAIIATKLGASWDAAEKAIASFQGLDRRMQRLGEKQVHGGKVIVIDDYGHHPTEVDTTLRALRDHYQPQRLICVFQPHQHSRTRHLMKHFAVSFSEADIVIVPHIYFVRDSEQETHAVTAGDLVDQVRRHGVQAMHLYPFEAIVEQLQILAQPGDLIVTMGAGDVWKIATDFLR